MFNSNRFYMEDRFMVIFTRLLFFFCIFTAGSAQAFLVSVKHAGMAVAGTAYAQDGESGGINPALIVETGTRVDVGMSVIHSKGKATISGSAGGPAINGTFNPYDLKNFYNPHLGIVKQFGCKWAASLVVYNKGHAYTQYSNIFPLLGTSNFRANLIQEIISPMVAYKVNRFLSVGIGVNIVAQKFDAYGLERLTSVTPPIFSSDPGAVTNKGGDYSYGAGICLGVKINPFPWLSFGASWQPKISMTRFKKYKGFLAEGGKMDHPETWNIGMMLQPLECVHVVFDVQFINYGDIPSLHNPLSPNFTLGVLGNPNFRLGAKNGAGFGWNNVTVYRLGADYIINDRLTVRAGWRYGHTPFHNSETAFNLATDEVTEHYVTGGGTWKWNRCLEISFYGAYGLPHKVNGQGSIPPIMLGGEVDLKQSQTVFGLSIGKLF